MTNTLVGLDTAKSVFQLHIVDAAGGVTRRKLRRDELIPFFERHARCRIVMEACGAAHHWGRRLTALGHEVNRIAPEVVKPFVKRGRKNDPADAAAICEAAARPNIKFVPIKSPDQQAILALHTARSLLVKQQTMIVNAVRGLASEFGLTAPQGISKMDELKAAVKGNDDLLDAARSVLDTLFQQLTSLSKQIEALEVQIVLHARTNETARRLATIPGVGPTTSSLLAATIADISVFPSARHFAAWLGLVPRQFSTGGKTRLGRITKAGNSEIRRLLVLGATSMVHRAAQWNSAAGAWLRGLLERRPVRLATVALANKMARIAWAVMTRGESYQAKGRARAAVAAEA